MNSNYSFNSIPLLVIVGPTAVGKTALGIEIAKKTNGEIVSADSAQIYRNLDIGTAKPSEEERDYTIHHLIDIAEPDEEFNVALYQELADRAIRDIYSRGKLPILVGGTGLYIKAVVDRFSFTAQGKDEEMRKRLYRLAKEKGDNFLYEELKQVDPESACKIAPSDRKRMVRALEVFYLDGKPLSAQKKETVDRLSPYNPVFIGLYMPREQLYGVINDRVEQMIENGFLEEVKGLLQRYPPHCRGLQVLGYRQLVKYLQGVVNWEKAVEEIKKETRRLAKRQLTWFRRDTRIHWLKVDSGEKMRIVEKVCKLLKENLDKKEKYTETETSQVNMEEGNNE